jgi:hypothetical protein
VDRFLGVWCEVIKKAPAPNADQKPDLYKPGDYGNKSAVAVATTRKRQPTGPA